MALDEATTALLRAAAQNPEAVPFHSLSPVEARRQTSARGVLAAPGPRLEETRDLLLSVAPDAAIRMRIHMPSLAPKSVVLYLHGGGWVLGDLDSHDSMARNLAKSSGATVVMAEYRKAPEHPFPVPVNDSWAAFEWIVENRGFVASPEAAIYVAGDSAGGNLAAVVAHRSRDTGVGKLAGQILIYPVVDHDLTRPSYLAPENQTLLPAEAMEYFWGHYLQDPSGRSHPEASPLKREDLSGLPPALVITAEHDVLRDEGEQYARALSAAGVDVELHRWQGQMHGFIHMVGILPASLEVTELIASRISENEKVEREA